MATNTTNIFNALSDVSQSMQLQLVALALGGNSPVSNAFTEEADRLGLTPRGRERKEREEQKRFAEQMEALREQTKRFQEQIDRLEQATTEALLENEEKLRAANEELKRIRDRAYEITTPDGRVEKVYRDGHLVRDDGGAVVDSVKPEELPINASTWAQRKAAGAAVEQLTAERSEIIKYHDRLARAQHSLSTGELSAEQMSAVNADVERMPDAVRRHYAGDASPTQAGDDLADGKREPPAFHAGVSPTRDFTAALRGPDNAPPSDQDFMQIPPSVSMPAPK